MNTAFDAGILERRYAFLDKCPSAILPGVITLPLGTLDERIEGVLHWREALLSGRLPDSGTWPKEPLDIPVRRALKAMGIAPFCRDQPELADAVLGDLIASFARQNTEVNSEVATRLRELEELERVRLTEVEAGQARREKRNPRSVKLDEKTLQKLRAAAELEIAKLERDADPLLLDAWSERVRAWKSIADVFGDLGEMLGRGWDLSQGVLKHTGWLDLLRLRDLVENLPQLRDIVRALGRLHATDTGESVAGQILTPVCRLEEERLHVTTPFVPAETRGIERSGEISRMLPVEASMLGHPKLRYLWHARRAERALLTYRVSGVDVLRVWNERETEAEIEGKHPRPERGPIIAVIDTSGSMHGLPEQVAKAIVLEAMRAAHTERRECFLFAYSGPGQVLEHELDLSPAGIGRLMTFLGLSFQGGNDEEGMMVKVVARLKEQEWRKADVIFVSDGEWPASRNLIRSVESVRDDGTRFHGVQIGNRGETGLHAICDPVHIFQDWVAVGGWQRR
ncbi:VWA domain-containing protein [bacterium]|nr:VWA domain-containing protein [bacterium]